MSFLKEAIDELRFIKSQLTKVNEADKKPKPRPPKNLRFQQRELWLADLHSMLGGAFDLLQDPSNEEGDIYATDKERKVVYGVWYNKTDSGITLHKPNSFHSVVPPRATLKQIKNAGTPYRGKI